MLRARNESGQPFFPEVPTGVSAALHHGNVLLVWSVDGAEAALEITPTRMREFGAWALGMADKADDAMPIFDPPPRRWWQFWKRRPRL